MSALFFQNIVHSPIHIVVERFCGAEQFCHALYAIMMNLARMMARDGEGATKLVECAVCGAENDKIAETVAKSVITSSLFKAMIFGEDANAGRIYCAIGYSDADFDVNKVDIEIASNAGKITVM